MGGDRSTGQKEEEHSDRMGGEGGLDEGWQGREELVRDVDDLGGHSGKNTGRGICCLLLRGKDLAALCVETESVFRHKNPCVERRGLTSRSIVSAPNVNSV